MRSAHRRLRAARQGSIQHLLLLSAGGRFPNGLADASGLAGRYMTGHTLTQPWIKRDAQFYPGMNDQHRLISRQFFRGAPSSPYARHDLRVQESSRAKGPRLKDEAGALPFPTATAVSPSTPRIRIAGAIPCSVSNTASTPPPSPAGMRFVPT